MKKKTSKFPIIAGVVLISLTASFLAVNAIFLNRPLHVHRPTYLYIDEDDSADSVCAKLETFLGASSMTGFRLLSTCSSYKKHVHTGAYLFKGNETTWHLFHQLKSGKQTPVKLTIPSVRTMERLIRSVSRQLMADSASLARLLNDSSFCAELGYDSCTLPALFIPNTYEVYWNTSPQQLIKRMQKEHRNFWNSERTKKAQALNLTPIEVATLASIVEEETANPGEKPIVAGLYLNRLRINMPLQADPTVKFGLKEFGLKRILYKHLETDSPYNTYKHAGLPPGPIRIPSINGLESVLNPARHNYLYMCAKEDLSGTHNFSSSLSQHQANARRYQQALNRRKIR